MPSKPPRICACRFRIPAGERCPCEKQRAAAAKARHDATRPSARKRGYDKEWQAAAAEFLRSHRTCAGSPGNPCNKPAVLVRHRISIVERPDLRLDPRNFLPGCHACNARDHHRERKTGGGRKFRASAVGPMRGQSRDIFPDPKAKNEVAI